MHKFACNCGQCRAQNEAAFEVFEFPMSQESEDEFGQEAVFGQSQQEFPFNEAEETELVMELLSVSNEEEMDQFLGKVFKGAWKGIKKAGQAFGKIARPLGGILKGVAKTALPFVGGALGSLIPIPGVGTAVGTALGGALSKALEAELSELDGENQDFEMARRFVRIAGTAAQQATNTSPNQNPNSAAQSAVVAAVKQHVPHMVGLLSTGRTGQTRAASGGRWVRRGNNIVVLGY